MRQTAIKESFFSLIKRALFGLGFIMVKDVPLSTWPTVLQHLIAWGQLMSFPLNRSSALPWANTPIHPLSTFFSYLSLSILNDSADGAAIATLAVASAWIGCFVFMAAHVGYNFVNELAQSEMELRILRSIALLSTTTLFLPFTTAVFSGLSCEEGSTWLSSGWDCDSGPRIGVAIVLSLLLVVFALLSLFVAAVFIDRNPASESWNAVSHGRLNVVMLCIKLSLAFLYGGFPGIVGSWFATGIVVLSGIVWVWFAFRSVPYVREKMNAFQVGLALSYLFVCVLLVVGQLWSDAEGLWLLVYVGAPMVAGLGFLGALIHFRNTAARPLEELSTIGDINIWSRARMQTYAQLGRGMDRKKQTNDGAVAFADEADDEDAALAPPPNAVLPPSTVHPVAGGMKGLTRLQSKLSVGDGQKSVRGGGGAASVRFGRPSRLSPPPRDDQLRTKPEETPDRSKQDATVLHRNEVLKDAEKGYRLLTTLFPDNELALTFAAAFHQHHSPFHMDEATYLAMAVRSSPSLDTSFFVYSRSRKLRESDGSGLSPIDRIIFDQKLREVRLQRADAYRMLVNLWEIAADPLPNLTSLGDASTAVDEAINKIDRLYHELLDINSESPSVLRGYATYLLELRNETSRAQELLNKAERIENSSSNRRTAMMRHFVLGIAQNRTSALDDHAPFVTVSGYKANLGEILKVSPAALQLFGYSSKSQLHGQNINKLIPSPIREVHDQLLLRFRGKRSSSVVDQSRLLLGVRRDMSIIPLWLTIMEAPPDEETCEPRLTGMFSAVSCTEEIVVFGNRNQDYVIHGCSAGAMRLLGLDGMTIQSERPTMRSWFPSISPGYEPQDVPVSAERVEWLQRAVAKGEITGELARIANTASVPTNRAGPPVPLASLGAKMVVARPLLELKHSPGLIPIMDTGADSEVDSFGSGSFHEDDDAGDLNDRFRTGSASNPLLVCGQVQRVLIPGLAPFHVLTFREVCAVDDKLSTRTRKSSVAFSTSGRHTFRDQILEAEEEVEEEVEDEVEDDDDEDGAAFLHGDTGVESGKHDAHQDDEDDSHSTDMAAVVGKQSSDTPLGSSRKIERPKVVGLALTSNIVGISSRADDSSQENLPHLQSLPPPSPSSHSHSRSPSPSKRRSARVHPKKFGESARFTESDIRNAGSFLKMKGGEGGSVIGGGSMTSGHSSGSMQLSRTLQAVKDLVETEVKQIRVVYWTLMFGVVVLAIVVGIWMNWAWGRSLMVMEAIEVAGERSSAFGLAVVGLESLLALNSGLRPSNLPYSAEEYGQKVLENGHLAVQTNEELFLLDSQGGQLANAYESEARIKVLEPSSGRLTTVSLSSLVQTAGSSLVRIGEQWSNMTGESVEVQNVLGVVDIVVEELELSLQRRHADVVATADQARLELIIGGVFIFVAAVVVASAVMISAVRSLTYRSREILSVFLLVPQRLAKAVHERSFVLLNKILSESHTMEEDDGTDSVDGHQAAHNDETDLQDNLIAEEKAEKDIERALKHIGRRNRKHRTASMGSVTERLDTGESVTLLTTSEQDATPIDTVRPHIAGKSFNVSLILRLILPVLFIFIFLASVVVWQAVVSQNLIRRSHRTVSLEKSIDDLTRSQLALSRGLYGYNITERTKELEISRDLSFEIAETATVAVSGGQVTSGNLVSVDIPPMTDSGSLEYRILVKNACAAYDTSSDRRHQCETFENKLLINGVLSSLSTILSTMKSLANGALSNSAYTNGTTRFSPLPVFTSQTKKSSNLVFVALDPYLQDAYAVAIRSLTKDIVANARTVQNGVSVLAWIFAIALCLFVAIVYIPRTHTLAQPLRASQRLLLLLPPDIIRHLPPLRYKIANIISDMQMRARAI